MEAVATRRSTTVRWLGRIGYEDAWTLQRNAAEQVRAGGPETLLLLEHDPVFTLGRNASRDDVLLSPERCRELSIAVVESDRGGKVTYHGPGQLVGYPILNLHPDRRDVKRYVTDLEEVLIRALADFGIEAARSPVRERVSSLWVGNDKIAAIGIHISRWVTTHGYALNVDLDPAPFTEWITACGLEDAAFTTIARELDRAVTVDEVRPLARAGLAEVFDLTLEQIPADEGHGLWSQPIHGRLAAKR
jgi:lipoyl(octanoyl) transferase